MTVATRKQQVADATLLYARAARLLDPLRLQVWEDLGITFPQLRILFLIRHRPGRDLRSLADRLRIGTSAASQQVERLVERGLVSRQEDAEDRRRIQLELTAVGTEAVDSVSTAARDYLHGLFERFTDEQLTVLSGALTMLVEAAADAPALQLAVEASATPSPAAP